VHVPTASSSRGQHKPGAPPGLAALRRDPACEAGSCAVNHRDTSSFRYGLASYHHRVTYAGDERLALCALLDATGPSGLTLCEGWTTLDLAAHLVLRERRPDAGLGIVVAPLAGHTRRVQRALIERTPFARLVQSIRSGPPRLSPFRLPGADERANLVEFFVHHEDVRRARPGWQPREIATGLREVLWRRLGMARFILRKAPVGIELARADQPEPEGPGAPTVRISARAGTPVVTVTGTPAELTMWATGRTSAARVRLDGSEAAVQALSQARWRL
jgi:uncharacterized protein (TIGR03085 family)